MRVNIAEVEREREKLGIEAPAPEALTPVAVNAGQFLKMVLPERKLLLSPWLPSQGLAMVYAPRGIGKTFFALNVAYAVASGGRFLNWSATESSRVLYIDGEMPASAMQQRLSDVVVQHDAEADPDYFRLVTPDLQPHGITPNLASLDGQHAIEPLLDGVSLVVVDNISTLCRAGIENDAESWRPVQGWALRLRSRGISVLFVHHAGKGGNQRGTSKREDVLDSVLNLKRPADYSPEQGARFEVHFEKARGFMGADADPIEACLTQSANGDPVWTWSTLEDSTLDRVIELAKEGLSQADIARELEVNRSTVSRHMRKAKAQGLLGGEL